MKLVGIGLGICGLLGVLVAACSDDPGTTGGGAGTGTTGGGGAGTAGTPTGGGMAGTAIAGSATGAGMAGMAGTPAGGGTAGSGGAGGAGGGGGAGGAGCNAKLGKAIKFASKVNDMIAGDLGADSTFHDGARTLELWAKFTSAESWTAEQSIIELGKPNGNNHVWGIDMSGRNGAQGVFGPYVNGVSDNNGTDAPPKYTAAVDVGWLHLSWAYKGNGGDLEFTVNGMVLPTQVPAAAFTLDTSPGYVLLGASQNFGNAGWDGVMDEVRIWNMYRTPAQIMTGMKQIMKPAEPGLVAYYQFNEGTGTDVADSTGKAAHKLAFCAAGGGACPAANAAMPMWVDNDFADPFTCAP